MLYLLYKIVIQNSLISYLLSLFVDIQDKSDKSHKKVGTSKLTSKPRTTNKPSCNLMQRDKSRRRGRKKYHK